MNIGVLFCTLSQSSLSAKCREKNVDLSKSCPFFVLEYFPIKAFGYQPAVIPTPCMAFILDRTLFQGW